VGDKGWWIQTIEYYQVVFCPRIIEPSILKFPIAPIRQPEVTKKCKMVSAQRALMEDLETEFPNHFITPHFKVRPEHTTFSVGICKQLLTVCLRNDLNRGWGLFWTNDSPYVYIGALTADNGIPKPVMYTHPRVIKF
jgi:hypothetical protein